MLLVLRETFDKCTKKKRYKPPQNWETKEVLPKGGNVKGRAHSRLMLVVVGVLTLAITASALFSLAQQRPLSGILDPLPVPVDLLTDITKRVPHPACLHCFKMVDGRYGIHEEVPGTGMIILREIPDPAPLWSGEKRPEFDEEGSPIWYVGDQGIVGPTDEEPVSAELPIPKIELRRIQARRKGEILSVLGVHGFGIGAKGFLVLLDPEHLENESRIPAMLEGIPVEVEVTSPTVFVAHADLFRRPVEIGVGITVVREGETQQAFGTLGPHIVRDEIQPGIACCQIWSLTAGHLVQRLALFPPAPGTVPVYQPTNSSPGNLWGYVAHSWTNVTCNTPTDPNCNRPDAPVNFTDQTPDVGAIAHIGINHFDVYPHNALTDPEDKQGTMVSASPIRRMKHGRPDGAYVSGPSGLIRTPGIGTNVKRWGAYSDASSSANVSGIDLMLVSTDTETPNQPKFLYCCVDKVNLPVQKGDSGALIAYDGTGERHVAGVVFAGTTQAYFTKAFDIQSAFINADKPFHYFWGTKENHRRPANSQCDGGC